MIAVKDELSRTVVQAASLRKVETAAMLRFAGGLLVAGRRVVVDAEVDHAATAQRLCRDLYELYGRTAAVHVLGGGQRGPRHYLVRVTEHAEDLARQTGLLDRRGRPVLGMPAYIVGGSEADIAAAWRGAFLARGALVASGQARGLSVTCPGMEAALALVGAARRLGVAARAREIRGADRVLVRDKDATAALLERIGAPDSRSAWLLAAERRGAAGSGPALSAKFENANTRRSVAAATAVAARVERALDILGDQAPQHLVEAGRLRLAHREAPLGELGRLADPPMSKDAVAGRIRRLLSMADREDRRAGMPETGRAG